MKITIVKMETPKRRRTDIIGNDIGDSFFDSFQEEGFCCHDILEKVANCPEDYVKITFRKDFLRKIVHSHLMQIRELEKGITGIKYAK